MKINLSAFIAAVAGAGVLAACEAPRDAEIGAAIVEDHTPPPPVTLVKAEPEASLFYVTDFNALLMKNDKGGITRIHPGSCVIVNADDVQAAEKEIRARIEEEGSVMFSTGKIPLNALTELHHAYWLKSERQCTGYFSDAQAPEQTAPALLRNNTSQTQNSAVEPILKP